MSKNTYIKSINNCGRKRKLSLREANEQAKARRTSTHDNIRVYKCEKCSMYHTTSKVKIIDWSKI